MISWLPSLLYVSQDGLQEFLRWPVLWHSLLLFGQHACILEVHSRPRTLILPQLAVAVQDLLVLVLDELNLRTMFLAQRTGLEVLMMVHLALCNGWFPNCCLMKSISSALAIINALAAIPGELFVPCHLHLAQSILRARQVSAVDIEGGSHRLVGQLSREKVIALMANFLLPPTRILHLIWKRCRIRSATMTWSCIASSVLWLTSCALLRRPCSSIFDHILDIVRVLPLSPGRCRLSWPVEHAHPRPRAHSLDSCLIFARSRSHAFCRRFWQSLCCRVSRVLDGLPRAVPSHCCVVLAGDVRTLGVPLADGASPHAFSLARTDLRRGLRQALIEFDLW